MEKLLSDYKEYIQNEKGLSRSTVFSYENDLKKYFEYLSSCKLDILDVSESDLEDFVAHIKTFDISQATVSRIVSSVKSMHEYLYDAKLSCKNPAKKIKKPKIEREQTTDILMEEEIVKMLSMPDSAGCTGMRDKAILEIIYGTGMKVSEIVSLNVEDVDVQMEYINCDGTRSKRAVPLGLSALESVKAYIEKSRTSLIKPCSGSALFLNLKGDRLTRQGLWKIIKGYAKEAGIQKNVTPSVLRNSFAVHMLSNGADIRIVSQLLGNSNISCLQPYVQSKKNARIELKSKHPRG
ncbi:tyrosine recombinase XerD [Peptoclostridium acidaminophilum DSM 3953]|uniref:Tyrosine recombinase XerD n=1 Tax=Peptoclostridium acidaminophilum DSM 3953 TaxID=1286171 RepID=W8U6G5_PEPAC|nr:tyrosine-type recombinase/integrase [Peptoclostridium acidaminophilum]AHM56516.1 tyrosine recombinase XerD [Peptoclostridium acidaminophilum DSM 3953]